MPSAPWPEIEAKPEVYINPRVLLEGTQFCSPAKMEVVEVWAWIGHIHSFQLKGKSLVRFGFCPQDDIVRLRAQAASGPTRYVGH